ncbi:MAG: hypothetical protein LBR84_02205, partial [Tannerella sp.]|nr:hypothetical protein [Tannerella sp.]
MKIRLLIPTAIILLLLCGGGGLFVQEADAQTPGIAFAVYPSDFSSQSLSQNGNLEQTVANCMARFKFGDDYGSAYFGICIHGIGLIGAYQTASNYKMRIVCNGDSIEYTMNIGSSSGSDGTYILFNMQYRWSYTTSTKDFPLFPNNYADVILVYTPLNQRFVAGRISFSAAQNAARAFSMAAPISTPSNITAALSTTYTKGSCVGLNTVKVRYRVNGTTTWSGPVNATVTGGAQGTSPASMSLNLTGLTPATTYQYQIINTLENGTVDYDTIVGGQNTMYSFTTLALHSLNAPVVSNISWTTADVNGTGTLTSGTVNQRYYIYRKVGDTNWTNTAITTAAVSTAGTFSMPSVSLSGLQSGTQYQIRSVARNSVNNYMDTSAVTLFTPLSCTVTVSGTATATPSYNRATIDGSFSKANCVEIAAMKVLYKKNSESNWSMATLTGSNPVVDGAVNNTTTTFANVPLTGLSPNTLYDYRLVPTLTSGDSILANWTGQFTTLDEPFVFAGCTVGIAPEYLQPLPLKAYVSNLIMARWPSLTLADIDTLYFAYRKVGETSWQRSYSLTQVPGGMVISPTMSVYGDTIYNLSPNTDYQGYFYLRYNMGTPADPSDDFIKLGVCDTVGVYFRTPGFGCGYEGNPATDPDGTAARPYQICTPQDMVDLSDWVASGHNATGEYFKVMNDLDMSELDAPDGTRYNFLPVGGFLPDGSYANNTRPFRGNFNGNGKIISNLYINRPAPGGTQAYNEGVGLFGSASGAAIHYLGMAFANVTGGYQTGGIAGYGQLDSCFIAKSRIEGTQSVGGLVGLMDGTIANSFARTTEITGNTEVGGLIGRNEAPSHFRNLYSVSCYVRGNDNVGGILGLMVDASDFSNIYSTSVIERRSGAGVHFHPLIGLNNSTCTQLTGWGYTFHAFYLDNNYWKGASLDGVAIPTIETPCYTAVDSATMRTAAWANTTLNTGAQLPATGTETDGSYRPFTADKGHLPPGITCLGMNEGFPILNW